MASSRIANEHDPQRDPVEELAEEFTQRLRSGERPNLDDYVRRHPELADEIKDLFPTIAEMERLQSRRARSAASSAGNGKLAYAQLGDYQVLGEIGRGGMGIVYEAQQVSLGRRVAVKVLPKHALRSEKDVKRFHREAQTAARLHHTNIVPVFGVGEHDDAYYIVMQFIHGVGLDEILSELRRLTGNDDESTPDPSDGSNRSAYIRQNASALLTEELKRDDAPNGDSHSSKTNGSLTRASQHMDVHTSSAATEVHQTNGAPSVPAEVDQTESSSEADARVLPMREVAPDIGPAYWKNVARIGVQAAAALQYAHSHGTLHRDVKPANLLLDAEGVVWIADFGLAKTSDHDNVTWTGDVVGTLSYIAPERFESAATERSDVYGLGLTLYELITLRRAFDSRDKASLIHQISRHQLAPPRQGNPEIPRDLETIVLKAVAAEPGDRYRTAGELAADLQNFLHDRPIMARRMSHVERTVRWCKKNRLVSGLSAAVAALLLLVTLVATIGYARQTAERQRVETTSDLAIEALEEIYDQFAPNPTRLPPPEVTGELDEEALNEVPSALPLSNEVAVMLESLLEFYDRLAEHSVNDGAVLQKAITANRRVGDIHHRLGNIAKAKTAYRRAIKRHNEMAALVKDPEILWIELARIYNGLGVVLKEQRNDRRSAEWLAKSLDLLKDNAETPDERYELARTYYLLHLVRDRHARHKELESAVSILHGLRAEFPRSPDYQFLLARCFLAGQRRPPGEKGHRMCQQQRDAIGVLESLVEEYPEVPDYRYALGDVYAKNEIRRVMNRGKNDEYVESKEDLLAAETRLEEALSITKNLETDHPNIPHYLMLKSRLHYSLANVASALANSEKAVASFQEAIKMQQQVVRHSNDAYPHEVWLSKIWVSLGEFHRDNGEYDEARQILEVEINQLRELARRETEHHWHRQKAEEKLRKAYFMLSDVLCQSGHPQRAQELLRGAEGD